MKRTYGITFAVLALGSMAVAMQQSLVAPALRDIQLDLHTSTTDASWILTAFLLSASVATPICGRLGDMFGKKRLLVIALAALAAGTLISALAGSLALMVAGRVVQGFGAGVIPLAIGIIRDEFPPERVASRIALISATLGFGGGLGIVLAGPIVDHLSYHWLFWLPLGPFAIAALGVLLFVPNSPVRARANRLGRCRPPRRLARHAPARDQRGLLVGVELDADHCPVRRRSRARARLGRGRNAQPRGTRRHAHDATARGLDD